MMMVHVGIIVSKIIGHIFFLCMIFNLNLIFLDFIYDSRVCFISGFLAWLMDQILFAYLKSHG
jgi:hypothetical protein